MRDWIESWVWGWRVYRLLKLSCKLGWHLTPGVLARSGLIGPSKDASREDRCVHESRSQTVSFQTVTMDWD